MSQPSTRSELKQYALRQLGAPVLEINLADEQCEDIMDDAIQFFQERHFDGVSPTFLKYQISQQDIDRGQATMKSGTNKTTAGIPHQINIAISRLVIFKGLSFRYNFTALFTISIFLLCLRSFNLLSS